MQSLKTKPIACNRLNKPHIILKEIKILNDFTQMKYLK